MQRLPAGQDGKRCDGTAALRVACMGQSPSGRGDRRTAHATRPVRPRSPSRRRLGAGTGRPPARSKARPRRGRRRSVAAGGNGARQAGGAGRNRAAPCRSLPSPPIRRNDPRDALASCLVAAGATAPSWPSHLRPRVRGQGHRDRCAAFPRHLSRALHRRVPGRATGRLGRRARADDARREGRDRGRPWGFDVRRGALFGEACGARRAQRRKKSGARSEGKKAGLTSPARSNREVHVVTRTCAGSDRAR